MAYYYKPGLGMVPASKEIFEEVNAFFNDEDLTLSYLTYLARKEKQHSKQRSASRDASRQKTYRVEDQAWKSFYNGKTAGELASFALTQEKADRLLKKIKKTALGKKQFKGQVVEVVLTKESNPKAIGECQAVFDDFHGKVIYKITLYKGGWTVDVLMHELAHCGNPHHDVKFRKDYLALVKRFIGADAWKELKSAFSKAGLRTTIHKPKSPEDWLKMYVKASKARTQKGR